jgi:hypothetical protein
MKPNQNYYRVALWASSGNQNHQISVASPEELSVMVDLLRNEDSCWYDSATKVFQVGYEPVG